MISLSIVVPCYNEDQVLPETVDRLLSLLDRLVGLEKITSDSCIYFVDDGSTDRTWSLIASYAHQHARVSGIKLSNNRGHQNALLAGLLTVRGDAVVSIDADLQDDINVIEDMVDHNLSGVDVVYGVRKRRNTDTLVKRATAEGYYKILQYMGVNVVFNHADFRLLSRRALDALKAYGEVNLFLRGVIPTIGFPSAVIEYDRLERFAGESKYPLRKMASLAVDGITSFSALPLRIIAILGLVVFLVTFLMSIWVLWTKMITGTAIPGWASSMLPILMLGGIQLLSTGVLGEYVAKTYLETKRRPRFIIEETLH
jgi:glycosyltransferase involved in cell wall biosynthesis